MSLIILSAAPQPPASYAPDGMFKCRNDLNSGVHQKVVSKICFQRLHSSGTNLDNVPEVRVRFDPLVSYT